MEEARVVVGHEKVRRVGVDETSLRRGHKFLTLFVGLEEAGGIFATEGRET